MGSGGEQPGWFGLQAPVHRAAFATGVGLDWAQADRLQLTFQPTPIKSHTPLLSQAARGAWDFGATLHTTMGKNLRRLLAPVCFAAGLGVVAILTWNASVPTESQRAFFSSKPKVSAQPDARVKARVAEAADVIGAQPRPFSRPAESAGCLVPAASRPVANRETARASDLRTDFLVSTTKQSTKH